MPSIDWPRTAARMRGDLDRANLSGRARRFAEFVIKITLMRRRSHCVLTNGLRAEALRTLKIGANHVAEVVAELEKARILQVKAIADGWEVLVYPEFGGWSIEWLYLREEMATLLTAIESAPGQVQGELLEPAPCLARALSETSAENASQPASNGVVPKMGTSRTPVNCNASMKQLNSEQLNPVTQLQLDREAMVLNRLRAFVGPDDVEKWGGDWRKNWIRAYGDTFERALATLVEEEKTGQLRIKKSRGAALKDLTRRYAGQIA